MQDNLFFSTENNFLAALINIPEFLPDKGGFMWLKKLCSKDIQANCT